MGIFKFKSTKRGAKPTREDMAKLIRDGITGTAMKKINELTEEDVQALTDYVIYLSIRGQLERELIDGAALDLDLESGERVIDTEFARTAKTKEKRMEELLEKIDADDLLEFDKFNEFAMRLTSEPKLEEKLKADDDDAVEALTTYLAGKYKTSGKIVAELNKLQEEPFEVEDETTEELAAELADALADRYEDHVDFAQELEEDAELKSQLEEASKSTTGKDLLRYELYVDAWEIAEDIVANLATEWLEAEDEVFEVPEPPSIIPVAESYEDFVALRQGDKADALAESVKRGQELFVGKIANCSKCHGEKGRGDGQTTDYDDWTKDWTTRVGLKPEDRESLVPLLARGALPPINAKPRNLEDGLFHGGSTSEDLYRRIMMGIEGTPMPAATFVEGQFEQDDVWHLINFIRSLQKVEPQEPAVAAQASL
jgi:mono/diheme cytochrome c family protein